MSSRHRFIRNSLLSLTKGSTSRSLFSVIKKLEPSPAIHRKLQVLATLAKKRIEALEQKNHQLQKEIEHYQINFHKQRKIWGREKRELSLQVARSEARQSMLFQEVCQLPTKFQKKRVWTYNETKSFDVKQI